ncbi:MAG: DUF3857 domain-containing protein [Cytophagaceae bacterium]
MKYILLLLSVILFSAFSLFSQSLFNVTSEPAWVAKVEYSGEDNSNENYTDGFKLVLRDLQFNVEEQSYFYHAVRKITSEAGIQNASEVNVNFDPAFQKLFLHKVVIKRDGRTINKLDPARVKVIQRETQKEKFIYDGSYLAYLIIEDTRVGDVVEYSYSVKGRNPVFSQKFFADFYLSFYEKLDKHFVRVVAPSARKLTYKSFNGAASPIIKNKGNITEYIWDNENIPGLIMDKDCPGWFNPFPWVEISEYKSWEELHTWVGKYFKVAEPFGSGLPGVIKEIESQNATDEERITAALDFVQNKIRYTGLESGIGGYIPESAEKVFNQRYGDCKGKSMLLCTMLKKMKITAHPALVNTTSRKEIIHSLPSPDQFNHCIVMVELKGKMYWYDPTMSLQGGSFDQRFFPAYGYALVLANGFNELVKIENYAKDNTAITERYIVEKPGGNTELVVETVYTDYEADNQRYYFSTNALEHIQKNYLDYYSNAYPNIEVIEPLSFKDDPKNNIFITKERYAFDNFWFATDTSKPLNIQCEVFPNFIRDKMKGPSTPVRKMPYALNYPLDIRHKIIFELPEEWNVTEEQKSITGPGFEFEKKVKYYDRKITVDYRCYLTKDFLEASEVRDFAKKQKEALDELGYALFYNNDPFVEAEASEILYPMVILAMLFSIFLSAVLYFLYRWDTPPAVNVFEPRDIGGWLILLIIGVIFTPFKLTFELFSENIYFNTASWELITDPSLVTYNPIYLWLIPVEMCFNISVVFLSVFVAILFFKKRSSFRVLFPAYLAYNIVFLVAENILINDYIDAKDSMQEWLATFRLIVYACIWIPYVLYSDRAKETFTRLYKPKKFSGIEEDEQLIFKLKDPADWNQQ